jgi:hypothetical protein
MLVMLRLFFLEPRLLLGRVLLRRDTDLGTLLRLLYFFEVCFLISS